MPAECDMTLDEAEKLLGVQAGVPREDIQNAYRVLARKYHPDKWINATPAEKKKATKIYEDINTARRILLNPTLSKQSASQSESADTGTHIPSNPAGNQNASYQSGSSYYGNANSYSTGSSYGNDSGYSSASSPDDYANRSTVSHYSPASSYSQEYGVNPASQAYQNIYSGSSGERTRTRPYSNARVSNTRVFVPDFNHPAHTYDNDNTPRTNASSDDSWASVGKSADKREKFNKAKSFEEKFGQQADVQEKDYAKEYERYATARYHKASDAFHWSWSILSTLMMLLLAIFIFSQNGTFTAISQQMASIQSASSSLADGLTDSLSNAIYPVATMFIACIVKIFLYDLLGAHGIEKALDNVNAGLHGTAFCIGSIILGVIAMMVMPDPIFFGYMGICIVIGIIMGIVHKIKSDSSEDE